MDSTPLLAFSVREHGADATAMLTYHSVASRRTYPWRGMCAASMCAASTTTA